MAKENVSVDWKRYYKDHLVSLEEGAKAIQPGDGIWMGQATQLPYNLLDEMHAHMDAYNYHDISLLWNNANLPFDLLFDPESKKHFRMSSIYCLPLERMSGEMGIMEYAAASYELTEHWVFRNGCNTVAVHLCPPDENGFCNFGAYGVSNGARISKDPRVKKIIALIDHSQFPIPGDPETVSIHVSRFDYIIEDDQVFVPITPPAPTENDKKIASFILPYVHEGDQVEIGYGGLGEEMLTHLKSIGKLSVYTEVACDNMAALAEEGVLTKIVAASPGACSQRFFDFILNSPKAHFYPDDFIINAFNIAKQENIVAINATFMVDLLGQACSEAQGLKPYSGTGGSFAFVYGAINAPGGRSFMCLRSTYTDKHKNLHSNIVPWLPEGSIVTIPKNYQMYIVSEYGLADVYLKSCKDRIKALIKIAHPKFRRELKEKICTTPLISEEDFGDEYDKFLCDSANG